MTNYNIQLIRAIASEAGISEAVVAEYHFALPRRWRFDYAIVEHKIAVEVEGGVWSNGRHTRGSGFIADMEKYNTAGALGWIVLRCVPDDVYKLTVWQMAVKAITNRNFTITNNKQQL